MPHAINLGTLPCNYTINFIHYVYIFYKNALKVLPLVSTRFPSQLDELLEPSQI